MRRDAFVACSSVFVNSITEHRQPGDGEDGEIAADQAEVASDRLVSLTTCDREGCSGLAGVEQHLQLFDARSAS